MTAIEFLQDLPNKVSPEALENKNTVFHFDLEGEGGGQLTLKLKDGVMTSEEGLVGDPKCVVKAKANNLLRVAQGDLNPMVALLTNKLSISSQSEMLKYAKIFGLM